LTWIVLGAVVITAAPVARGAGKRVAISQQYEKRRAKVTKRWLCDRQIPAAEIAKDEFLAAAVKFADTALKSGRDTYGKEHTPLFADVLNINHLKAPRAKESYGRSTDPHPIVPCFFQSQQNLLRLLTALSSITGQRKYVDAAYDATAFMFQRYQDAPSGLLYWGNHRYIDLASGQVYGSKGGSHEIEDVFPFWEFMLAVDPTNAERLVKGMWESHLSMYTNVQDQWDCFYFNRHGIYRKRDLSKTWDRPWNGPKGPKRAPHLSFISIMLDCSYGAFCLGFANRDDKPITWAERFAHAYIDRRDPRTKIWPHLSHRERRRERGLSVFGHTYPRATEPRLYAGHIVEYVPRMLFGGLAMVETAQKHGYAKRIGAVSRAVEQWVLGYMTCAYDPKAHRMRHIIIDGTDLTGHVFQKDGYFGAKKGGKLAPHRVTPLHHAAVARAYRLFGRKAEFWSILRDLFRGADLGKLPRHPNGDPRLNYETTTPEPGYAFAFLDLYRATKNREYLRMAERIGRNIIRYRQHRASGLFTLENTRVVYPGIYAAGSPHLEPHEKKTVFELFGHKHRTAALDTQEPLALLSIYACRKGQFDKAPMWVCGGLYPQGRAYSSGHVIRADIELWFDKPALEQWYKDRNIKYTRRWLYPED